MARKLRFVSLNLIVSITLFSGVSLTGYTITWLNTPVNYNNYFANVNDEILAYAAVVIQEPVSKVKSTKVLLTIQAVKNTKGWHNAAGKIILFIKRDSIKHEIKYGQRILVIGAPQMIEPPKNPEEFNYKQYIGFQGIRFQHYINKGELSILNENIGSSIIIYSLKTRRWCEQLLNGYVKSQRERAIALALILGIKDQIDNDISAAYAAAGAMHVLAVSGLHVGVIYWILSFALTPLKKRKIGKWLYLVVALVCLWSYAFVTGYVKKDVM